MTILIGQIVGCLLVAAGIGGAVGWLLRHLSAGQLTQQFMDVTATLRLKEQTLEKAQYELNAQAAAMQILESKIDRVGGARRIHPTGTLGTKRPPPGASRRVGRSHTAADGPGSRRSLCSPAGERSTTRPPPLHRRKKPSNSNSYARRPNRHSSRTSKNGIIFNVASPSWKPPPQKPTGYARAWRNSKPAQGRVHWLEVQLSDRDAEHRAALHQLDSQLAERDRRIGELEPLTQRLPEQQCITDTVGNEICPHPHATRSADCHVTKTARGTGPTPSPAPAR